jgi:hypothetical protein
METTTPRLCCSTPVTSYTHPFSIEVYSRWPIRTVKFFTVSIGQAHIYVLRGMWQVNNTVPGANSGVRQLLSFRSNRFVIPDQGVESTFRPVRNSEENVAISVVENLPGWPPSMK